MIRSFNYNNMKKADLIERCKKLEELLMIKNINIANELEHIPDSEKKNTIDKYFKKINFYEDNDEVKINIDFGDGDGD